MADGHEVLYDEPRGYPRLTCLSDGCENDALVRQPYMSDENYIQKVWEYLGKHLGGELRMRMEHRDRIEICAKNDPRYEVFLRTD